MSLTEPVRLRSCHGIGMGTLATQCSDAPCRVHEPTDSSSPNSAAALKQGWTFLEFPRFVLPPLLNKLSFLELNKTLMLLANGGISCCNRWAWMLISLNGSGRVGKSSFWTQNGPLPALNNVLRTSGVPMTCSANKLSQWVWLLIDWLCELAMLLSFNKNTSGFA